MSKKITARYVEMVLHSFRSTKKYTPKPFRACFFDMDGVLFDSMPAHARSWVESALEYDIISEPLDFYRFEGQKGSHTIEILFERSKGRKPTESETKEFYLRKTELFALYNHGDVIPGSSELVADVCRVGLRPVLVTGSSQTDIIERLGLKYPGIFNHTNMLTGTDVLKGKPHPEPYLKALERANVSVEEAFVVENAPMGVRAAVDAGLFTIAVNTGCLPDSDLEKAGASLLLPSMDVLRQILPDLILAAKRSKR